MQETRPPGRPQQRANKIQTRKTKGGEVVARYTGEVPRPLLALFDAKAKGEGRSRVAQLRKLMEEFVALEKS